MEEDWERQVLGQDRQPKRGVQMPAPGACCLNVACDDYNLAGVERNLEGGNLEGHNLEERSLAD